MVARIKDHLLSNRNYALSSWSRSLGPLKWWHWGKAIGALGLFILTIFYLYGRSLHPALIAIILHMALDFTFQSHETALRKRERGHHLLVHSLVAGGLPLAVAGLVQGSPACTLFWTAGGVLSHYITDWSRRFGLKEGILGIGLDQICHISTILLFIFLC